MKIIYVSETSNTERMAELISEGVIQEGKDVELLEASKVKADDILNEEILVFGSPACGVETIEENTMEPLIESLKGKIDNKKLALFGSYGWGDGEWLRSWEDKMISYGAVLVEESLAVLADPSGSEQECIEFGKKLARQLS